MEIRDEQRRESIKPNLAALLTLCVVLLIWTALSPIWIPGLAWLLSLFEPAFLFLAKAFAVIAVVFIMVMCPIFLLAAVALVLGGGAIRSH
jgi:hypothetical protein